MSIYDTINSAPQMSLAQARWQTNNALSQLIGQNLATLVNIYNNGYRLINQNQFGLSVPDVVIGVGPADWQKFYTEAVMLKTLINHSKPYTIQDTIGECSVSLGSSDDSPAGGSTISLTFSLTPASNNIPTGSVSFYDGPTLLGQSIVSAGQAVLSVTVATGDHELSGVYSGDINFVPQVAPLNLSVS